MLRQRLIAWFRLLFEFGLSSGFAQAIGMVSGLVYVRYMPISDYALYGLAATTLTFVTISSDLGLNSSITYFWRKARLGGVAFGDYLAGIRHLRLILFVSVGVIAAAIFPAVGQRSHYGLDALLIALTLLLGSALLQMSAGINLQVMRLLGWFRRSYICDIAGQSMRVLAAAIMVLGISRSYWMALLGGLMCSAVTLGASSWMLRGKIERNRVPVPDLFRAIMRYVGPAAPAVLAFALQDSVILWLAARFGGPQVVASVFAVNRITAIVGIVSTFSNVVIVPRLAGITDIRRFILAGWVAKAIMAIVGLGVIAIGALLPGPLLWLLGPRYMHLDHELLAALTTAAITLVMTPTVMLNRAKGWVRLDPVIALVQIALLIVMVPFWDFTTPLSVLLLSMMLSGSLLLQGLAISIIGAFRPNLVAARS
ncbi:oligosaccharide flippase family protein [Sphingomonas sp. ERG5]|uniref:oligosaccharide flippase family protein n=1 Tax=Sphingomonas sp. ERG5 TaxID=1381597 RepID=UPI001364D80B|nr:oligosaccharide flippase family protein [Sphingomonas sp. ERG5]